MWSDTAVGFVSVVRRGVGKLLLARTMRGGIDLRKLRYLPDSMTMPFKREGLDPLPDLARLSATAPVTRLTELFGKGIWLVSGYDEARGPRSRTARPSATICVSSSRWTGGPTPSRSAGWA